MTRRRKDFLPPPQYICHLIAANPLEITIADDRPRGAFWNECPQFIFSLWVRIPKRIWDSKGMANSFGSGFPIGARAPCWQGNPKGTAYPWQEASNGGQRLPGGKNPKKPGFRGTRLCWQSLVCYTFGDRGWRKGVVRGRNKQFQPATEQADFGAPRAEIQDLPQGKIRLFVCR